MGDNDEIQNNLPLNNMQGEPEQKLDEAQLLAYLNGNLSADEQHDLEHWLSDDGMESDALDGLKTLSTDEIKSSAHKLNQQLNRTVSGTKRPRRKPGSQMITLISIVTILLLAIVAYFVVRLVVNKG